MHGGLNTALGPTLKISEEVTHYLLESQIGHEGIEWSKSVEPHTLMKRKTTPVSEARKIVMCVHTNGYEAWRRLMIRYQAPIGIRRMRELAELTQLQNKRCKNAAETSLIVLEIDRRTMLLEETGGSPPSDDMLTSVLWMAMGPGARSHVSGKIDV